MVIQTELSDLFESDHLTTDPSRDPQGEHNGSSFGFGIAHQRHMTKRKRYISPLAGNQGLNVICEISLTTKCTLLVKIKHCAVP